MVARDELSERRFVAQRGRSHELAVAWISIAPTMPLRYRPKPDWIHEAAEFDDHRSAVRSPI